MNVDIVILSGNDAISFLGTNEIIQVHVKLDFEIAREKKEHAYTEEREYENEDRMNQRIFSSVQLIPPPSAPNALIRFLLFFLRLLSWLSSQNLTAKTGRREVAWCPCLRPGPTCYKVRTR